VGVDWANQRVSRHEQVKKFRILPVEWTAQSEELTPTLKLRRRVITQKYVREIAEIYEGVREPV
jgi:long-chain acyl-CoA synthetase